MNSMAREKGSKEVPLLFFSQYLNKKSIMKDSLKQTVSMIIRIQAQLIQMKSRLAVSKAWVFSSDQGLWVKNHAHMREQCRMLRLCIMLEEKVQQLMMLGYLPYPPPHQRCRVGPRRQQKTKRFPSTTPQCT